MRKRAIIPGLGTKAKIWATLIPIIGLVFATIGVLVGVCTDWIMLADEAKARDYVPSTGVEKIAEELQLTRKGKSIFYATGPQLQNSVAFNKGCGNDGKDTYTLGCYWKDDAKNEHIALYDTGISELNENGFHFNFAAERNVTALHEMLHAVYERLDEDDKVTVCSNAHLIAEGIPSLKQSLAIYPESQYCTEVYARIGSEYIAALSGKDSEPVRILSEHYQQYFSFNYELAQAHRNNQTTELALGTHLMNLYNNLSIEKARVESLKNNYYRYPSVANLANTNAAIDNYNSRLAEYKTYYSTHERIRTALNSEASATLASL